MTYDQLIAEHDAIDRVAQHILTITRSDPAQPEDAAHLLEAITVMVRDHLAREDPMIYAVGQVTQGGRHAVTAAEAMRELQVLNEDWTHYIYRWTIDTVRSRWPAFVIESEAMLGRLHDRIGRESAVLYSLAVHHALLAK